MVLLSSLIFSQQREEIVERYSNGVKKSIVVYKGQGSKERLVKKLEYYENEKIKSSTDWKDGKPNGDFIEWYYNGQKEGEGTFKDGELDEKWTWWYMNGQKKLEGTFNEGKDDGLWTWWYDNGQKGGDDLLNAIKLEGSNPAKEWMSKLNLLEQWKQERAERDSMYTRIMKEIKNEVFTDSTYIDELARELYPMAKPGEKVFKTLPRSED